MKSSPLSSNTTTPLTTPSKILIFCNKIYVCLAGGRQRRARRLTDAQKHALIAVNLADVNETSPQVKQKKKKKILPVR